MLTQILCFLYINLRVLEVSYQCYLDSLKIFLFFTDTRMKISKQRFLVFTMSMHYTYFSTNKNKITTKPNILVEEILDLFVFIFLVSYVVIVRRYSTYV